MTTGLITCECGAVHEWAELTGRARDGDGVRCPGCGHEMVARPQDSAVVFLSNFTILRSLVSAVGLASTFYLVTYALYLPFLAAIFGASAAHLTTLGYIREVVWTSVPACAYAAIGIAGLLFWRSERFSVVGLFAIATETILVSYAFARPERMPIFSDLFLK